MEKLKPDATGIYVAAHQAPGAIEEAIEAEVPLIVAVAEHIPIHDILRVRSPTIGIGVYVINDLRYTQC
jgi:succinyl-CoA synthetase alpha subunit